jgi:tight adherence protein C
VELAAVRAARPRRARARRHPLLGALRVLGRLTGRRAPKAHLSERLAAAGVDLAPDSLAAVRAGAAVMAVAVVALFVTDFPGRLGIAALIAAGPAAHALPELVLRRRARARGARMDIELPDILDLLAVAVAAGLSPERALAEVGARHAGELAQELRAAAGRAALGVSYEAVLAELERRCPAHGVPMLLTALRRAHRHGSSLAPTLEALAADARAQRSRLRLEAAARAAPKIQLVVALLLVPSVLALVAAALIPALGGVV